MWQVRVISESANYINVEIHSCGPSLCIFRVNSLGEDKESLQREEVNE
jgi:hypothetical protein